MSKVKKQNLGYKVFWRFYLHNLALLVLVFTMSAVTLITIAGTPPKAHLAQKSVNAMTNELAQMSGNKEQVQEKIEYWNSFVPLGIAVYTPEGKLFGKAGEHVPESLKEDDFSISEEADVEMVYYNFMIHYIGKVQKGNFKNYIVLLESPISDIPKRFIIILSTILILLSLLSLFAMKHLSKPLEHIITVSNELSKGNLSARTKFKGKGELKTLAESIDAMAENLDARLKYEKELMANIAHEFRTPLARTRVALEICEDDDVTADDIKMQLTGIAQDVDDLELLIQNIFSMSLLDLTLDVDPKKRLKMKKAGINVKEFLTEVSTKFHEHHFNHSLELEIADDLKSISMDIELIRRTIKNLLENSVKYSDSEHFIKLSVLEKQDQLIFSVSDRGIDLPDNDLSLLFDPFFRSDRSQNRSSSGGIGLGLALCKRIVEAHGGEISARHNPDGGLIVEFTLPY